MYALNIDPRNPQGDPAPVQLRTLGVEMVRYTFKDATTGSRPEQEVVRFYRQQIEELAEAGIASLVILTNETYPNRPVSSASDEEWAAYITRFAERAAEIAKVLAPWRPALQIWNAPDLPSAQPGYDPILSEVVFAQMLAESYQAVKKVDSGLKVITAGLVSGQPGWLARVIELLGGALPADAVAIHPYMQRPQPDWPDSDWGSGFVGDLITEYRQVVNLPLWITEIGVDKLDDEGQGEYLRRFYQTITSQFTDSVEQVFWFCYGDAMAEPFGLIDTRSQPKPAYQAYGEVAQTGSAAFRAQATVSLDRLHYFASYLEQNIVFGDHNQTTQRQMMTELRGNFQRLSKLDIWRVAQQMLAGSTYAINQQELNALDALQGQKDLYGILRSIVLTVHQKTGALTGRLGAHTRISAETEANASTNTEAVMQVLADVQPGNRMIIMDAVKATADEGKLHAPDIFETDIYGQHRNGLVDNHAWNLQKLVRAIRNQGYENRVILMIRLDGPDDGANVNPFNSSSIQKYQLAIAKFIRYLEAVLPTVPFKLVLGNEPDLPHERQWSDPLADPRLFTLNKFAPAMGDFIREVASQRPDVTFLTPALSANLKHDNLSYYTAFFGQARPINVVSTMHGYGGDVTALPGDRKNLLEQQAEALRVSGGFPYVSGTEIGSGNPFGDCESLSEKGRFADVVIWILLSVRHQTPLHQDNHWNFRIDPGIDDPTAGHLGHVINRSKNRVLRNIRERNGSGLQILQGQPDDRSAYSVEYVSHNTPATMVAGQTNAVSITIRNTSYRTWPAGGPHPVRVGYHWYTADGRDVSASLWDDHRTALPFDLQSGDSVTLNCDLGAPRAPGSYEVRWDIVEELRTWFAWQGVPTLDVRVTVNQEAPETPSPPSPTGMTVKASHNNRHLGADNLQQAIDNNPFTRWSTQQSQKPEMWFQIDLGEVRTVSHIRLNNDPSPRDYPRGYIVTVSVDERNWTTVAENPLNDRPLNVTFNPRQVRFIRIQQTGSDPVYWWSIHDIEISAEVKVGVSASHNNVLTGPDNLSQALDERPETRWSSRALQRPGMWFEIDLNETQTVSGVVLDTTGSPNDYPRGYVVLLSTDRGQWTEVARNDQNKGALNVSFSPHPARYIRIEQTGQADRWWWSIHGVTVKSGPFTPSPTVSASHNNVLTGADNLSQALDERPETRWSSRALQRPGMWFEVDLNETQTVSGVALDTAGSPNDYPRGYVVRLSTDRGRWTEVARNDQNKGALDVSFSPHPARYIRIEQTGQADRWWWSIHGVTIQKL